MFACSGSRDVEILKCALREEVVEALSLILSVRVGL